MDTTLVFFSCSSLDHFVHPTMETTSTCHLFYSLFIMSPHLLSHVYPIRKPNDL